MALKEFDAAEKVMEVKEIYDNLGISSITRAKMKMHFDDDKVAMSFSTPAENQIVLSEEDEEILLSDQHGNSIKLNSDGITLESASDFKFVSSGDIKFESGGAIELAAGSEFKAEGASGVEVSSSATAPLAISRAFVHLTRSSPPDSNAWLRKNSASSNSRSTSRVTLWTCSRLPCSTQR